MNQAAKVEAKVEWKSMQKNMKVIYQNHAEDEKKKNKVGKIENEKNEAKKK